jgi:predicted restriction endonuclease
MTSQTYEPYWQLTLEYSDFNGERFITTLATVLEFIDKHQPITYSETLFDELQREVVKRAPKKAKDPLVSTRKAINQCVKLGFIEPFLEGYHPDAKLYVSAPSSGMRSTLFSKIVYSSARFNSSVTKDDPENAVGFIVKTLQENQKLHKKDIVALMTVTMADYPKGYLNQAELAAAREAAEQSGFIERKYNQVSYLWNVLGKLDDMLIHNDYLYLKDDTTHIVIDDEPDTKKGRDPYLHRIYKNQLKEESQLLFGAVECMLEHLQYPVMVASHIKPFVQSNPDEAYDPNNGLLLSPNMDAFFDKGYITFTDQGEMVMGAALDAAMKEHLSHFVLDSKLLNDTRRQYLAYHREHVFRG